MESVHYKCALIGDYIIIPHWMGRIDEKAMGHSRPDYKQLQPLIASLASWHWSFALFSICVCLFAIAQVPTLMQRFSESTIYAVAHTAVVFFYVRHLFCSCVDVNMRSVWCYQFASPCVGSNREPTQTSVCLAPTWRLTLTVTSRPNWQRDNEQEHDARRSRIQHFCASQQQHRSLGWLVCLSPFRWSQFKSLVLFHLLISLSEVTIHSPGASRSVCVSVLCTCQQATVTGSRDSPGSSVHSTLYQGIYLPSPVNRTNTRAKAKHKSASQSPIHLLSGMYCISLANIMKLNSDSIHPMVILILTL